MHGAAKDSAGRLGVLAIHAHYQAVSEGAQHPEQALFIANVAEGLNQDDAIKLA